MAEQSTPAPVETEFKCVQCSKTFGTSHGLFVHIGKSHSSTPTAKPSQARADRRGRPKGKETAEDDAVVIVRAMFDGMASDMEKQQKLVSAIVDGYGLFVERMKRLRLAYIKAQQRLRQLHKRSREHAAAADAETDVLRDDEGN